MKVTSFGMNEGFSHHSNDLYNQTRSAPVSGRILAVDELTKVRINIESEGYARQYL